MKEEQIVKEELLKPKPHIGLAGASGRLGRRLQTIWAGAFDITPLQHIQPIIKPDTINEFLPGFYITDKDAVERTVQELVSKGAKFLINCAGIVTLDASEAERGSRSSPMYQVHVVGARNLAEACRNHGLKLVHFSTEYVFDGKKPFGHKYAETDKPDYAIDTAPTWYGLTKALGEQEILNTYPEGSVIIRLSQVQSPAGGLFFATLKALQQDKHFTRVNNQLVSAITDTTVAHASSIIIKALQEGAISSPIYHVSSTDSYSSYRTCLKLANVYGLEDAATRLIIPVTLEDLVRSGEQKVVRPKNTVLDVGLFERDFGTGILGSVESEIQCFHQSYPI